MDSYNIKFESFGGRTLYEQLDRESREFIRDLAFDHRFTFQEFRQVVEAAQDLSMWKEGNLEQWWSAATSRDSAGDTLTKKRLLDNLRKHLVGLKRRPSIYRTGEALATMVRERRPIVTERSDKNVAGWCPVASDKTVCCNLRTIDAVENCVFGCSYCSVQTFYGKDIVFDRDLAEKLKAIPIDPNRFYHYGTGQASDSLAFGNRDGILDALCAFAADHSNILLEFKTKSDNIRYFVETTVPANIVCSWSLNTPAVIENEEHFTACFDKRVGAARRLADAGVKVAFHFHPMVHYEGWESDYVKAAETLVETFDPSEVLFVSFGSVTMIKPALKRIRELGNPTKMTQIDFVPDPHGKLTYPDDIKIRMFRTIHLALEEWHEKVFIYLCMEKAEIWQAVFGRAYPTNEEFERDFGRKTMPKLAGRPRHGTLSPAQK